MTPELYRDIKLNRGQSITPEKIESIDKALEKTATAFATFVNNKSVADLIHAEAVKKFDGQTEVLLSTIVKQLIDLKILTSTSPLNPYTAELQAIEEFANAPIHLFWYNAEKWDGKTLPMIAFVKTAQRKDKNAILDGHTADGKKIKVSEEMANAQPVIIVNFNERVKINPKKVDVELPKSASASHVFTTGKPTDGVAMLGAPVTVELANVAVHGQRSDYEGWFNGDPEFYYVGWERDAQGNWTHYTGTNASQSDGKRYFFYYMDYTQGLNDIPNPRWQGQYHVWQAVQGSIISRPYPFSGWLTLWNDFGRIPNSFSIIQIDFWEEDTDRLDPDDYLQYHQIGSGVTNGQVFKQNSPIEAQYRTNR